MKYIRLILLAMIICVSISITSYAESDVDSFSDTANHWAKAEIDKWEEEGWISGYPDGTFKPDDDMTIAEFISLVNTLYGYHEVEGINYSDVESEDWYANQAAIAKSNRYMEWYDGLTLDPDKPISREEVSVILAEIMASKSNDPEESLKAFGDMPQIEEEHQSQVAALIEKGYLTGYPDGTYKPQGPMTRAEIVNLMDKILGRTVTKAETIGGDSEVEVVDSNMTIFEGGTSLKNIWIKGDLILTARAGSGNINLDNVIVDGHIIIDGGDGPIRLDKSSASDLLLLKRSGKSQIISNESTIDKVIAKTNSILEGDFEDSIVEIESKGKVVELKGSFETIVMKENSTVEIDENTYVDQIKVDQEAHGSSILTSTGSTIRRATFDGAAELKGSVSIDTVVLNTDGVIVEPEVRAIEKKTSATDSTGVHKASPSSSGGSSNTPPNTPPDTPPDTTPDTTAPTGYQVSFEQTAVNHTNQSSIGFSFISAEVGADYTYSIDDMDAGTAAVNGTGSVLTTSQQVTGINVSGLSDDTLTLTVYLKDKSGNQGLDVTDTITKETIVPSGYNISIDQTDITSSNESAMGFTFASAEVGTTYSYSVDDTNSGTSSVTGSGTVATATDQISGIDVSGLDDGVLTLKVTLTDAAGNVGLVASDTVTKEATPPSGYTVAIDQSVVITSNETAISFTFDSAEVGASYNYSIDDTNSGTTAITGNGTLATATDQIVAINVSGLEDGTLTLTVYLTDNKGNQGVNATANVTKDTSPPSGYGVNFDQSAVNSSNESSISFAFTSAEVGADYAYSIDDSNASTSAVTGSGTITSASDRLSSLDLSGLDEGTLTLTVYLTDNHGNQGNDVIVNIVKDTSAPSAYGVSIDQALVNNSNDSAISFTFTGAEGGTSYHYSIDDTNSGTTPVTGSGTISTAIDQITGIDVSGLDDDSLTLTVYLTDIAGNQGSDATTSVLKDTSAPSGYSVSIDQTDIRASNDTAMSFTFASAQVGATYSYSIDDTNSGTSPVTGNGNIATASDQISNIDVSGLSDGTLNLSVTLTSANGNVGLAATDSITKDATPPAGYGSTQFDQSAVLPSNETAISFTFVSAEVGATYHYSIDDSNGSTTAVTGSGTIASATDQISGLNLSSLDDGTLTLTVYLTDDHGNQGLDATANIIKDTNPPSGYTVTIDQSGAYGFNDTKMSFTFGSAEVGSTYHYSFDDTNGGTPAVTGTGTISTASDQITGINVSGLDDETLTLTVYLTDSYGNQGSNTTATVAKDSSITAPSSYIISVNGQPSWPENGTYHISGSQNGKPQYTHAGIYFIQWSGTRWELIDDIGMLWYNTGTDDVPPGSNWVDGSGSGYTMTVTAN